MRVLALARSRLRGALTARVLLAPVVALVALQLVGLAGGPQPPSVLMVTATCFALPVLGWVARQVLDAAPDDQVLLDDLAVGGPVRGALAGLVAAWVVAAPLGLACAWGSLLLADSRAPAGVLAAGTLLALASSPAAVAVGAVASRGVAGRGGAPVLVLVGAPVLVAVVGLAREPLVTALVPRLDAAVRAVNPQPGRGGPDAGLVRHAPGLVLQVLLWSAAVLAVRLRRARRGPVATLQPG